MTSLRHIAHLARDAHPEHARTAARAAWQTHGLVLINLDWLTSWPDRKQAELLAEKLFGKRGEK